MFLRGASALPVSFVGAYDSSNISANTKTIGPQTGYGGGILFGFPLGYRTSLETGAVYFNRGWTDKTAGSNTLVSQVLLAPVVFKLHFHIFSVGAGGYYASNLGSLNQSGAVNNSGLSYGSYGINPYDYGLIGEVAFHIFIGRGLAFKLQGDYLSGLTNVATVAGSTFQYRDILVLAGFTFHLGSGEGDHIRR